jgi:uncharacterized metal-binding protein
MNKENLMPSVQSSFTERLSYLKQICNKLDTRLREVENYFNLIANKSITEAANYYFENSKSDPIQKMSRVLEVYIVPLLGGVVKEFNLIKKGEFALACDEFRTAIMKNPKDELEDSTILLCRESVAHSVFKQCESNKDKHGDTSIGKTNRNCTDLHVALKRLAPQVGSNCSSQIFDLLC